MNTKKYFIFVTWSSFFATECNHLNNLWLSSGFHCLVFKLADEGGQVVRVDIRNVVARQLSFLVQLTIQKTLSHNGLPDHAEPNGAVDASVSKAGQVADAVVGQDAHPVRLHVGHVDDVGINRLEAPLNDQRVDDAVLGDEVGRDVAFWVVVVVVEDENVLLFIKVS